VRDMPPNEECPICHRMIEDWHIEWYMAERSDLYRGLVAMDCPLCGQPVGYFQGRIGLPPPGVPLVRRSSEKAAAWAALGAMYAGGTLNGYLSTPGAGTQFAIYWPADEIRRADETEQAKHKGP